MRVPETRAAQRQQAAVRSAVGQWGAALWAEVGERVHVLGAFDRQHLDATTGWTDPHCEAAMMGLARAIADAMDGPGRPTPKEIARALLKGVERSRRRLERDGSGRRDRNRLITVTLEGLVKQCRQRA